MLASVCVATETRVRTPVIGPTAALLVALLLVLVVPVLIWYGWYRLVGYDRLTLTLAHVAQLVAAAGVAAALRLGWRRRGLAWRDLAHAVVVGALGYAAVALGAWLVNLVGDGNLRFARACSPSRICLGTWRSVTRALPSSAGWA